jgi:hypothetical protein
MTISVIIVCEWWKKKYSTDSKFKQQVESTGDGTGKTMPWVL